MKLFRQIATARLSSGWVSGLFTPFPVADYLLRPLLRDQLITSESLHLQRRYNPSYHWNFSRLSRFFSHWKFVDFRVIRKNVRKLQSGYEGQNDRNLLSEVGIGYNSIIIVLQASKFIVTIVIIPLIALVIITLQFYYHAPILTWIPVTK